MTNFAFTNRFGMPHNPAAVNRAIKRIVDTHNSEEEVAAKKEKQKHKERIPMIEERILCNILHELSLLIHSQCSPCFSGTTITLLYFTVCSIYRILPYDIISHAGKADVNFLFDRYISTKTELRSTTYSNYLYTWNHFIRDTFGKKK